MPRHSPVLSRTSVTEKAAKFAVPLPKVKGISEEEMFKVVKPEKRTQEELEAYDHQAYFCW